LFSLLFNGALSPQTEAQTPPAPPAADTGKLVVTLLDTTRWQPAGGEFRFTITGNSEHLDVCLGWDPSVTTPCPAAGSLTVRQVAGSSATPPVVTFAAALPRDLTLPETAKPYYSFMPASVFTAAYVRVSATNMNPIVFTVGITRPWYAGLVTALVVLIAGWALYSFAIYLGVPGPENSSVLRLYSVPLRLISRANGWASLSQFQIVLWSFVIGAGAVYVMTLTGALIPISAGTLALLGIAGGATVLSEVKASQQAASAPPGPVLELHTVGEPVATEVVVAWFPPAGGATVSSYVVQYAYPNAPNQWRFASRGLRATSLRIVGLQPATNYRVRVLAANVAGNSVEAVVAAPTAVGTAPAASVIKNLRAQSGSTTPTSLVLKWDAPDAAGTDFVVQTRPADSDEGWTERNATAAQLKVSGLKLGTGYNFRVRTKGEMDAWSDIQTLTTAARFPRWSDIVTDTDRPAEIDVTRVQMLFFTVISAFFVALKIIDTGTIPEIDPTYVMLMGISNGVYLSAKFVRN
jgi:hypothetical protein